MMKLLIALLAVQLASPECAAALKLRGVGAATATQMKPYVTCLNSTIGREEQLRVICSEPRARAIFGDGKKLDKAKLDRAVRWLDAMVRERAVCETHLSVEP